MNQTANLLGGVPGRIRTCDLRIRNALAGPILAPHKATVTPSYFSLNPWSSGLCWHMLPTLGNSA